MIYILNIETSTTNCSVSLSENGRLIGLKEDNGLEYSHAERLHLFIEEVINEAKITAKDLSAIAISKGPGSYTGLRIGVSAAKGLCFALEIPLISVSTLEALADQIKINEGIIITMLDARRMEVYSAVFDKHNNQIRETKAQVLDENSFKSYLNEGKVYFVGNGVQKSKEVITHENAFFIENKLPSSENMSKIAYDKYKKSDIEDVAYFEPFYLKDFIALKPKF